MADFVVCRVERVYVLDVVSSETGGGCHLDPIGVSFRDQPAICDECDRCRADIFYWRRGLDPVIYGSFHFRLKRLLPELAEEHVNHTLSAGKVHEFIYQLASREISLIGRSPYALLTQKLAGEIHHLTYRISHALSAIRGLNNVHVPSVEVHAGVLFIHPGYRRYYP